MKKLKIDKLSEISKGVLRNHMVRKNKKQKEEFADYLKDNLPDLENFNVEENEKNKNYKAFKKLITNIQFLCVNKIIDKKVMLVTSPEKEVGKSYVVANMAIIFAKNYRCLL